MTAQAQQDPFAHLIGAFGSEAAINAKLDWAEKYCFLISPSTTCALRPGCSVAFNLVRINPDETAQETHDVGKGKLSLLRNALYKLSGAAGIVFDPDRNVRVPPDNDPRLVHWHVVAAWRGLDGEVLSVPGDYCLDLRDGSAASQEVLDNIKSGTPEEKLSKGRVQLQKTRAKIFERAQTGAELRAIRKALHIRTYTAAELRAKPFVIARLVYDGHDENPAIELENKRAIRGQMLGGSRALFGPPPAPAMMAPALAAPPQVRAIAQHSYEDVPDAEVLAPSEPVMTGTAPPAPVQAPATPPPATTQAPTTQTAPQAPAAPTGQATPPAPPPPPPQTMQAPSGPPTGGGHTIPGGKDKGVPVEEAGDETLRYWVDRISGALTDGTANPRFADRDRALVAAMRAEQAKRAGSVGGPPPPPPPPAGDRW